MDRETKKSRIENVVIDDAQAGNWEFACICGLYVRSSDPVDRHPSGNQFECVSCRRWQHTDCYVEFEDCPDLPGLMYCKACNPVPGPPIFRISTVLLQHAFTFVDFPTRLAAAAVSQGMYRAARASQRRLAICHTSPDVAVRLLTVFYKVEHLTLYCWSQRMAKWIPEPLESLKIIAASPNLHLTGIPRRLLHLAIHDAAVTDAGVTAALSRGDRSLSQLATLDLSCTSVTGDFVKALPSQLRTLWLCGTALSSLPFARSSSELEELDVSHSLLSDDALHKLPSNLRKLNLSYTRISGEALVSMVLEKPSRHLWLVLYRGMPALSASQRARVSSQVTLVV